MVGPPLPAPPSSISRLPVPRSVGKRQVSDMTITRGSNEQEYENENYYQNNSNANSPSVEQRAKLRGREVRSPGSVTSWGTPGVERVNRKLSLVSTPNSSNANYHSPQSHFLATPSAARRTSIKHTNSNSDIGERRITVCVRKRPLPRKSTLSNIPKYSTSTSSSAPYDCIQIENENKMRILVEKSKLDGIGRYVEESTFQFDKAFNEECTNQQLYDKVLSPLISHVRRGGKSTCFAYGQTGSGKSHTMFHPSNGICFIAANELVRIMTAHHGSCRISFFEIYQGMLFDLLQGRRKIKPCEGSDGQIQIMGLTHETALTGSEAKEIIDRGLAARMTGKTGANDQSSRSHAILQFSRGTEGGKDTDISSYLQDQVMTFVDLAGSERGADRAEADRKTKQEGSEINKSLLALKECIRAMDLDASHIPFRQNKLTLVLKDSFIGNVRTAMIATVSPSSVSAEPTLNTLRYAERFHEIALGLGTVSPLAERELDCVDTTTVDSKSVGEQSLAQEQPQEVTDPMIIERPCLLPPLSTLLTRPSSTPHHVNITPNRPASNNHISLPTLRKVTFNTPDTTITPKSHHTTLAPLTRINESIPRDQALSVIDRLHRQIMHCDDKYMISLMSEQLTALADTFDAFSHK